MNKQTVAFKPYKKREYLSTKDVVTRLIDEAGGAKMAAHLLGCSPTQTVAYSDPATPEEIKLDQVRRLVSATKAKSPAEDLALLAGGIFVPMGSSDEDFSELAADSAEQCGAFVAMVIKAGADGKYCGKDRREILPLLDRALRLLVHARAQLVTESAGDS